MNDRSWGRQRRRRGASSIGSGSDSRSRPQSPCPDCDKPTLYWSKKPSGTPYLYCVGCGLSLTTAELGTFLALTRGEGDE